MPPAYEVLLLNTAIPQIQAAQSGDTYVVPRDIAINATAIISANSATDALRITQTGAGNAILVEDSANPDSTPFVVNASGDVGIGTTSPGTKLDVVGAGTVTSGTMYSTIITRQDTTTKRGIFLGYDSSGQIGVIGTDSAGAAASIAFWTYNGSAWGERMRLDTSGNLGLGVTPSPWNSSARCLDVLTYGGFFSENGYYGRTGVANNAYLQVGTADNYIYKVNSSAQLYDQKASTGEHRWFTAPSGTAGNAISFTQAMTLDASGNLVLGTTSAYSNSRFTLQSGNTARFAITDGTTSANMFTTGGSFYITTETNSPTIFITNGTERARITSGGDFLVNTVNNGRSDSNSITLEPNVSGGGYAVFNHLTGSSSGRQFISFAYAGTEIGSITQNGTTGVLYNITSDYRLKDVVGAVTNAGARIDALKPVDYTWKADGSAARGFLAHEFQAVYPSSVTGTKDAVDEEGKPVYQNMQASTSEVIADLVAELQSLRARVAQLEAK